ncbi:EpsG family protein [Alkalicoccus saliphilus]|uniref:EpsG family protein n=1 Tax=Alkalicoccus saliphilus TaxID=200989 RepID=A0A2T4U3E7_9BACI|nr:EpsG family protein [Alkalicoccus saliphilus]PTL37921.1 hypothetical protein C6Y45_14060 [Alkalicoccus saliphilus]
MIYYFLLTLWVGIHQLSPKDAFRSFPHTLVLTAAITITAVLVTLMIPITGDMERYLNQLGNSSETPLLPVLAEVRWETGFLVFQWLIAQITTNSYIYIGVTMSVMWILLLYTLPKMTPFHFLPLLLFGYLSFFEYFNLTTNLIRQGLAVHMLPLLLVFLKDHKYIKSLLLLGAALLFHLSAVVMAGLIVLRKLNLSIKFLMILLAASVFFMLTGVHEMLMMTVVGLIGGPLEETVLRFTSEEFMEKSGGQINRLDFLAFTLFWAAWGIAFYYRLLRSDEFFGWLVKSYLAFASAFALFAFIAYSDRIAMFAWFLTPLLLFYPMTKMTGRTRIYWTAGAMVFAVAMIFFFDVTEDFSHLLP